MRAKHANSNNMTEIENFYKVFVSSSSSSSLLCHSFLLFRFYIQQNLFGIMCTYVYSGRGLIYNHFTVSFSLNKLFNFIDVVVHVL